MTIRTPDLCDEKVCTRCGCCVSVCPQKCIRFEEYPVKGEECTACRLCEEVCPGHGVNLKEMAEELFHKAQLNEDVGRFIQAYIGYSNDERVREKATSGGVVTSLLIYLLEQGVVDGALVVSFDEKEPWKTNYVVATSKEEIIKSAQTKYQVTPLKGFEDVRSVAVVGLPCVVEGLRKAQNHLGEKVKVLIGLFCWVNMEREATEFLLEKMGVTVEDVASVEYRSGDYLGGFKVQLKNGEVRYLGKECYNVLPLLFAPQRCVYCGDFTNELADISVGDAKFVKSKKGHTFIITRSQRGEDIVRDCANRGYIQIETCEVEDIVQSESSALQFKEGAYRRTGTQPISYGKEKYKIPVRNRFFELLFVSVHRNRKFFKKILKVMPLSLFKLVSQLITRERS